MRASSTPSLSMRSRWATSAPNICWYHATAASRSRTAMPTWSMSVSLPEWAPPTLGPVTPEQGDAVLADLGPELWVVDTEPLLGGETEHPDLPLVQVVVDLIGGLAHLRERMDSRQNRLNHPLGDQAIGLPRLLVIGEMA